MIRFAIARYCLRCGLWPVSRISPTATICDVCFVRAVQEALNAPFCCPGCETEQTIGDERFVCDVCGYVEELEED